LWSKLPAFDRSLARRRSTLPNFVEELRFKLMILLCWKDQASGVMPNSAEEIDAFFRVNTREIFEIVFISFA
jgi:hypothetical protein